MDDHVSRYVQAGDVLPVFPLPEFVLFPQVTAPLHIFEPRYRQMMDDVLDSKGVFCMAVLRNTGTRPQLKEPAFWGLGCACRLMDYDRLPDGRFNILVQGLVKVRLQESSSQKLYRRAKIDPDPLPESPGASEDQEQLVRRLMDKVAQQTPEISEAVLQTLHDVDFTSLLHLMAFHSPAPVETKLKLLYATSQQQLTEQIIAIYESCRF